MFLPENASYVVDGVGVSGWLPGVFCALLRHFSRRFVEVREEWAGLEAGAFGGFDDFSDIFPHRIFPPEDYFYCALLGVNCMQGWPGFFCGFSGLFCGV